MNIRLALADDQVMVRKGLRFLCENEDDLEVVAEAGDGVEAVEMVHRHRPDVLLLDIGMPRLDGLAAAKQILSSGAPTRIVILTTFESDHHVYEALRLGVSGFVLKVAPPEHLLLAIRTANDGHALLDPLVTRRVMSAAAREHRLRPARDVDPLTMRETEILTLVGRGLSNAQVAAALFLSPATVKTHLTHVFAKLGARDRAQLVIHAYESGLVRVGDDQLEDGSD